MLEKNSCLLNNAVKIRIKSFAENILLKQGFVEQPRITPIEMAKLLKFVTF